MIVASAAGRALTSAPTSFGASLKTVCVERSDMGDDPHCSLYPFLQSFLMARCSVDLSVQSPRHRGKKERHWFVCRRAGAAPPHLFAAWPQQKGGAPPRFLPFFPWAFSLHSLPSPLRAPTLS